VRPSDAYGPSDGATLDASAITDSGLLEMLIRALERHPERLDDVAGLMREFGSDALGRDVLPEQFESIWRPIWEARKKMSCQSA